MPTIAKRVMHTNKIDIILEYLNYIDSYSNTVHNCNLSDATLYPQGEHTYFLIVEDCNFVEQFNQWLSNSIYHDYLVDATGHDCIDSEDWWLDFLTDVEWGFADQWQVCSNCGKVVCYYPSSGEPDNYWITDGGDFLCEDCIRDSAEEYISTVLVVSYETGVPIYITGNRLFSVQELYDYNFEPYKSNLEVGMYGTYDDPRKLLKEIIDKDKTSEFLVNITSNNPFATYYEIWKRNKDEESER